MRIAVAGGTGTVGAHLVRLGEAAGHEVRVLSRATGTDLTTGAGLDLAGVDAVVDVSGPDTVSAGRSRSFFKAVTTQLIRAEERARVRHHVALSIVGAAEHPHGYYAGKALQERLLAGSSVAWTVQRTTQFFEFAEQKAVRLGPWAVLPLLRCRPIAAATAAERLLRLAEGEGAGVVRDLAGPEELRMAEVGRRCFARRGDRRRVVELPLPGAMGTAFRDGSLLPGADAEQAGPTLAEWLDERTR